MNIMTFKYYYLMFFTISCFKLNDILSLPTESAPNKKINPVDKIKEMCTIYMKLRYKNFYEENPQIDGDPIPRSKLDCVEQEPLIVGGEDAHPKEFPHMALIGYGEKIEDVTWNCGGSLISERFVLSAAHCNFHEVFSGTTPKWVRLGELNRNSILEGKEDPKDYRISTIYIHPSYKSNKIYNDIILYKLHQNVTFNAFIRPLCLYPYDALESDVTKAYITGWGTNETGGNGFDMLQKAKVDIVETVKCENTFKSYAKFSDGFKPQIQLCAGDLKNGSDTCLGDSGGPLQILVPSVNCMYYQIGITSAGVSSCGDKIHPAVYTNVGMYLNWIQEIVWPN